MKFAAQVTVGAIHESPQDRPEAGPYERTSPPSVGGGKYPIVTEGDTAMLH